MKFNDLADVLYGGMNQIFNLQQNQFSYAGNLRDSYMSSPKDSKLEYFSFMSKNNQSERNHGKGGGNLHHHRSVESLAGRYFIEERQKDETAFQFLKRTTGKSDKVIKQMLKEHGVDHHGKRPKQNNKH